VATDSRIGRPSILTIVGRNVCWLEKDKAFISNIYMNQAGKSELIPEYTRCTIKKNRCIFDLTLAILGRFLPREAAMLARSLES